MNADDLRARFVELTHKHLAEPLRGGFTVRPCPREQWEKLSVEIREEAFPRGETVNFANVYSAEEREAMNALTLTLPAEPLEHRLLFLDGERVVGSFWGMQEAYGRYYMISTAIRPSHQRRGLYSA